MRTEAFRLPSLPRPSGSGLLEEDLEGGVHRAAVLEEPDRAVEVDRLVDADE
jgi:hypothetical protein